MNVRIKKGLRVEGTRPIMLSKERVTIMRRYLRLRARAHPKTSLSDGPEPSELIEFCGALSFRIFPSIRYVSCRPTRYNIYGTWRTNFASCALMASHFLVITAPMALPQAMKTLPVPLSHTFLYRSAIPPKPPSFNFSLS